MFWFLGFDVRNFGEANKNVLRKKSAEISVLICWQMSFQALLKECESEKEEQSFATLLTFSDPDEKEAEKKEPECVEVAKPVVERTIKPISLSIRKIPKLSLRLPTTPIKRVAPARTATETPKKVAKETPKVVPEAIEKKEVDKLPECEAVIGMAIPSLLPRLRELDVRLSDVELRLQNDMWVLKELETKASLLSVEIEDVFNPLVQMKLDQARKN